jgi:hypothetical protein
MRHYPPLPESRDDEDRIGRLLELVERNNRLLVALARDNGLDEDGNPVDTPTDHDPVVCATEFSINDCCGMNVSILPNATATVTWRRHYRCCWSLSEERSVVASARAVVTAIRTVEEHTYHPCKGTP